MQFKKERIQDNPKLAQFLGDVFTLSANQDLLPEEMLEVFVNCCAMYPNIVEPKYQIDDIIEWIRCSYNTMRAEDVARQKSSNLN